MCKTKLVDEATECEGDATYFLGSVDNTLSGNEKWTVHLDIRNTPVGFKIDTGANVCVISEEAFERLETKRELHPPKTVLKGPGDGQLG